MRLGALVSEVSINLLASAIFAFVLWVAGRLLVIGKHRRIWRLNDPDSLIVCVARSGEGADYNKAMTGVGQLRATALLMPSLQHAYPRLRITKSVLLSTDQIGHELEKDLVCLGGGKTNQVTAIVLEELWDQHGLPARTTDVGLEWRGEEAGEFLARRRDREVVEDFGLIVNVKNPFDPRHRLIVLAGASTFGTISAARYLLESGVRHRGEWAAIVRSRVSDGFALKPTCLRYATEKAGKWG